MTVGFDRRVRLLVALALVGLATACGSWSADANNGPSQDAAPDLAGDTAGDPAGDATLDGLVVPVGEDQGSGPRDIPAGEGARGLPVGAACALDPQCDRGFCATNFAGGYCTSECSDSAPCQDGAFCGFAGAAGHFCYAACAGPAGCRAGYSCSFTGDAGHCVPAGDVVAYDSCLNGGQCVSAVCVVPFCNGSPCVAGVCSQPCDDSTPCPSSGVCERFTGDRFCVRGCAKPGDCPQGQTCREGDPGSFCAPQ